MIGDHHTCVLRAELRTYPFVNWEPACKQCPAWFGQSWYIVVDAIDVWHCRTGDTYYSPLSASPSNFCKLQNESADNIKITMNLVLFIIIDTNIDISSQSPTKLTCVQTFGNCGRIDEISTAYFTCDVFVERVQFYTSFHNNFGRSWLFALCDIVLWLLFCRHKHTRQKSAIQDESQMEFLHK